MNNNSKKKKIVYVLLRQNKNMDIWLFNEEVSVVGVFDDEEQAKSAIWEDFDNLEHDERVDKHMVDVYWKDDNRLLFRASCGIRIPLVHSRARNQRGIRTKPALKQP